MTSHVSYLRSTRHPWPCLLFVLPLVIAYECGVVVLGGPHPENLRNGADNWLRVGLTRVGISWVWLPPAILLALMAVWTWKRRQERPNEVIAVLSGMILESIAYAIGLWTVSRALGPLLEHFGIELSAGSAEPAAVGQVITYLGAGIYEEALFRLILFSCILRLLRILDVNGLLAILLAASASALLFSAAHHIGPYGQPYSNYLFLFRLIAGLYFAFLFQARGFGIAVGAHACYNLMVSIGAS
ncbi:MAG TPA: CPBP family glutamic-type intramembrane protease [Gemmataceae bacterium]|nr:CPBP family glutamic-type intramembrane protease [Gemmataceae bacterium]